MSGIYQTTFNLINQYIFDGAVLDVISSEHIVCAVGAMIVCSLVVYVPIALARYFLSLLLASVP